MHATHLYTTPAANHNRKRGNDAKSQVRRWRVQEINVSPGYSPRYQHATRFLLWISEFWKVLEAFRVCRGYLVKNFGFLVILRIFLCWNWTVEGEGGWTIRWIEGNAGKAYKVEIGKVKPEKSEIKEGETQNYKKSIVIHSKLKKKENKNKSLP